MPDGSGTSTPRTNSEFVSDLAAPDAPREDADPRAKPPRVGMWFIVSLALMTAALFFAKQETRERAIAERQATRTTTFVRTRRTIPPFQRLTGADLVTMKVAAQRTGSVPHVAAAIGRITTQTLDSGVVVMEHAILSLPGEWWLLSVPAEAGLALAAGDSVALLGGTTADSIVVDHEAVALGMAGGKAVIAMPPHRARSVARYLVKEPRMIAVRRVTPQ